MNNIEQRIGELVDNMTGKELTALATELGCEIPKQANKTTLATLIANAESTSVEPETETPVEPETETPVEPETETPSDETPSDETPSDETPSDETGTYVGAMGASIEITESFAIGGVDYFQDVTGRNYKREDFLKLHTKVK